MSAGRSRQITCRSGVERGWLRDALVDAYEDITGEQPSWSRSQERGAEREDN